MPSITPDPRLNFNQAGTVKNVFAPVFSVEFQNRPNRCTADIISGIEDSWSPDLGPYMRESSTLLSHYEISGAGAIFVRKSIFLGSLWANQTTGITKSGNQNEYPALYLENWIPFHRPTFTAMALGVNANGQPDWWYNTSNIPYYPAFRFSQTNGYAVVYDKDSPSTKTMISVAFGTKPAQCVGATTCKAYSEFNSKVWNNGIGVLPAINLPNTPIESLIDQSFYILPYRGLTSDSIKYLKSLSSMVSPVDIYYPQAPMSSAVIAIQKKLKNAFNNMQTGTGIRTQNLGGLAKQVP
jgi:hypothetical protein